MDTTPNMSKDGGGYKPHFASIDGHATAHEYASAMQDSPANNYERTAKQMRESGNNPPKKHSVHVWGHGADGPEHLGKFDRALPKVRKGQAGVLLQHPTNGPRFMPNGDIHAIEHRIDAEQPNQRRSK